jgi:hypothetical protein
MSLEFKRDFWAMSYIKKENEETRSEENIMAIKKRKTQTWGIP